ncbi:MAG: ABC transporter substrate-binding protein [Syntrophobacteraceae bacterium]
MTKVIVVSSHKAAPYEELLEGFKAALTRSGKTIEIQVSSCEEFQKSSKMPTGTGAPGPANLFFTIGARALTLIAQNTPSQVPILTGMVLGSEEISGRQNITGVTMEFPIGAQLEKMRQILPKCRNIGIIYSPANTKRVELAAKAAESAGFNLHTRQVNVPSELPEALQYLASRIDVLWGIPDDLVYTQQTAKYILLYSFRNRIPLAGLSASWTKAGALYSLEWDYRDLGIQCAEFALKIIDGTPPSSLQPTGPRKILYTLNLKTAQHLKLEIPHRIVQGASQIFE